MQLVSQFIGGSSFMSHLIEWNGTYSHVDLVADDGQLWGAQASEIGGIPAGVQIRPAGYEKFDAIGRVTVEVTQEQYDLFWNFLLVQLGKPYDNSAIAGFVAGRNWQTPDAWFCSELCMAAHVEAKVFSHPLAVVGNKIDPNTAFAILSTWGEVEIVKKSSLPPPARTAAP